MCCNSNLDSLLNTDRYSFALGSCGCVLCLQASNAAEIDATQWSYGTFASIALLSFYWYLFGAHVLSFLANNVLFRMQGTFRRVVVLPSGIWHSQFFRCIANVGAHMGFALIAFELARFLRIFHNFIFMKCTKRSPDSIHHTRQNKHLLFASDRSEHSGRSERANMTTAATTAKDERKK